MRPLFAALAIVAVSSTSALADPVFYRFQIDAVNVTLDGTSYNNVTIAFNLSGDSSNLVYNGGVVTLNNPASASISGGPGFIGIAGNMHLANTIAAGRLDLSSDAGIVASATFAPLAGTNLLTAPNLSIQTSAISVSSDPILTFIGDMVIRTTPGSVVHFDSFVTPTVPEPSSLALGCLGLVAVALMRKRAEG